MDNEHKKIITRLKRLAADWPSDLWVFAADGQLNVMLRNPNGERDYTGTGGVNPAYLLDGINIASDGGDW